MHSVRTRAMGSVDDEEQTGHPTETLRGRVRRVVPLLVAALAAGVLAGVLPPAEVARACTCVPFTPIEAMERADAVFHGRVTRMRWIEAPDPDAFDAEVTFQVFDWWKGPEGPTFTLHTAGGPTLCDFPLVVGERYLVFAKEESPGHFIRPPCSGTHEYNADFARGLGPPVVVAPVEEPPAVTCDPCDAPPPPSDALLSASAVFHGWAIEIEHMGEGRVGPRRITFEVVRWWKGGLESVVTLDVPYGYWTCFDNPFGMSRREFRDDGYIVYADRDLESGALVAQRCGRTARFGRDEASALGPGSPPDGATETATAGPTPTASPTGVPGEPVTATATPVVTPVAPPEPEPTRTPPIGASPAAPGLPGPPAYFPLALDSHFVGSDSLEPVGQVRSSDRREGADTRDAP